MRWDCNVRLAGHRAHGSQELGRGLLRRGVRHAVLVQAPEHSAAHHRFAHALLELAGRACGVAALRGPPTRGQVNEWAASGVRGVWLPVHADRLRTLEQVLALEESVPAHWPVELSGAPAAIARAAAVLARCPRVFVCALGEGGCAWPDLQRLLWWCDMGNLYLKLGAAADLAESVLAAVPDRLLWGSGWPDGEAVLPRCLAAAAATLDRNARCVYGVMAE